ncbi:MAG: LLM class flavin-dependent oxidoreductase [candidate division Zixibacteria bacterium]|nr:LLM class flavin-dependent oxidoreductase [candidate division Zixibacteria bacterium]
MTMRFDYFYGGHVALQNIGFAGLPVDERSESDEHLASVFDIALDLARTMDRAGYDTLWFAEHHFQREGYGIIPNIPMLAVYLAGKTQQLRFGSMFNIVPAWHPLRLAEDFAMADRLTGGRIRFGIGRGYIPREVETLGSPLDDDQANRALFEEQVEIVFKAWNNPSFSHHGTYYRLPPEVVHRGRILEEIALVPRPRGPVECWQPIVSVSPRGIDFMIRHGIKGVVPSGGRMDEIVKKWREALHRAGRETLPGEGLAIVVQVHLADTQEQAIREATTWYEEQVKVLAPLRMMPGLTETQIQATFDPLQAPTAGLPTIRDMVRAGSWICGPPEHVFECLSEIENRFPGLERIVVGAGAMAMPPDIILRDLAWFGTEVLPKFTR